MVKSTAEPNDNYVEAVVIVNEMQDKLKGLGINYNSEVSVWEGENDQKIFTMLDSSDPIAKQRTLQAAILADGRGRLIETHESTYPPDADLHPGNARIIKRGGSVSYLDDVTKPLDNNFFSEILDIFKVDNS